MGGTYTYLTSCMGGGGGGGGGGVRIPTSPLACGHVYLPHLLHGGHVYLTYCINMHGAAQIYTHTPPPPPFPLLFLILPQNDVCMYVISLVEGYSSGVACSKGNWLSCFHRTECCSKVPSIKVRYNIHQWVRALAKFFLPAA